MPKQRKIIKDFKIALKDLELAVKQLKPLHNGRDMENFSLRPREAWANWLLCVTLREIHGADITFGEDQDTDGILLDKETGQWVLTEHVSALDVPSNKPIPKGEERIIQAINKKIEEGPEYMKNKILVVFFDGTGEWYRNKVRESIKGRHNFIGVFGIGLVKSGKDGYTYTITEFHENFSISYKVEINGDFTDWKVTKIS